MFAGLPYERHIMNFTPKTNVGPVVRGILTIAVVGLIGWVSHFGPTSAPIAATQSPIAVQESFQNDRALAVEPAPALGLQTAKSEYYQPISAWYKNKHWWKRNAPIVGGAAGGALIGGFVGGGKGALIGGAAGGGGGYLYKRSRHNHRHYK
jgi:hypothetical protein